jgi:hypothetical protein
MGWWIVVVVVIRVSERELSEQAGENAWFPVPQS